MAFMLEFKWFSDMATVITDRITKTPEVCGGKACIAGHRVRVMDIVVRHEDLAMGPDEIVAVYPELSLRDVHAALAYEGVKLLAEALKRCGPDLTQVKEKLAELKDLAGLAGPLAFGSDQRLRRPAFVVHLENGTLKMKKKYPAEE